MRVRLNVLGVVSTTTLDEFLTDNADGFDADEAAAIRAVLDAGGTYEGGGGAGVDYTLEALPDDAPDLLPAMTELLAASDAYDETEAAEARCHRALDAARAAVARARGRQPGASA